MSLIAPHDVTVGEQQQEKTGDDANRIYDHSSGDAQSRGVNEQHVCLFRRRGAASRVMF